MTAFPRKDGFTRYCTDLFIRGVAQTGTSFHVFDLTDADIHPCKGCYHCWCTQPGVCIQKDGMQQAVDLFMKAEGVVFATPLYAYNISGYLKCFLERTLPLLSPGVTYTTSGIDRNKKRYPEQGPRDMAAIVTGGLGSLTHADGAVQSLRHYAEGFDMTFQGALVRNESYLLQFVDTKPKTIKAVELAYEHAGRMFAADGKIDPEIIATVATPLACDQEHFQLYSNVYWEHAEKIYGRGGTRDEIMECTRNDIRILMHEMVINSDPVATSGIKAVLLFSFPDTGLSYRISINNGSVTIEPPGGEKNDLTITCSSEIWAGIIHQRINPLKACADGEILLSGEKDLFRKMGRFFPPPNR